MESNTQRPMARSLSFNSFTAKLASSLCDGQDSTTVHNVLAKMAAKGILSDDPRLAELLRDTAKSDRITRSELLQIIPRNLEIFKKTFYDKLAVPDWSSFKARVHQIYEETKLNEDGKLATYIPQIAKANTEHFGVSICTIDGQQIHIGDCEEDFSVQSCCKIVNYCIALEAHGSEVVHKYVGKEPSGVEFNAITLDKNKLPHNPCTNAGAIMVCSLIGRDTVDIDGPTPPDSVDLDEKQGTECEFKPSDSRARHAHSRTFDLGPLP